MMGNLGGSYVDSKLAQAAWPCRGSPPLLTADRSGELCRVCRSRLFAGPFRQCLGKASTSKCSSLSDEPYRAQEQACSEIPGCDARLASSHCAVIAPAWCQCHFRECTVEDS